MRRLAVGLALLLSSVAVAGEPETAVVTRGDLVIGVEASGELGLAPAVAGEVRLDLFSGGSPPIVDLASAGHLVEEGQVVLRLRTRELERSRKAAERDLTEARAERSALRERREAEEVATERGLVRREETLEEANHALETWFGHEKPLAVERDRLEEEADRQAIENERAELEQLEKMYEEDELVDETEGIVLARARYSLERRLAISELNARQRAWRAEHERPRREIALRRAVRNAEWALETARREARLAAEDRARAGQRAERAVHEKELRLADLRHDLEAAVVRAPATGILLHGPVDGGIDRRFRVGQVPDLSQPVVTVVDPGRPLVRLDAPAREILRLRPGQRAEVRLQSGGPLAGEVVEVAPFARDGVVRVVVRLRDPVDVRLLGSPARAEVALVVREGVLTVPLRAVGGDGTVRVRTGDGEVRETEVRTGEDDGERVVVLSGLSEGDEVLLSEDPR